MEDKRGVLFLLADKAAPASPALCLALNFTLADLIGEVLLRSIKNALDLGNDQVHPEDIHQG